MTRDRKDGKRYKTIYEQDRTRLKSENILRKKELSRSPDGRCPLYRRKSEPHKSFNHLYRTRGNDVTTTTDLIINKPYPELNKQRNQNTVGILHAVVTVSLVAPLRSTFIRWCLESLDDEAQRWTCGLMHWTCYQIVNCDEVYHN